MSRRRAPWIILGLVIVLAAAGGAYYYFRVRPAQAAKAAAVETPTISTSTVTRGDLVLSASGSGTLVPRARWGSGFKTAGR